MYSKVRSLQSFPDALADKMVEEGLITKDEVENIKNEINSHFENEFQKSQTFSPKLKNTTDPKYKGSRALTHKWSGMDFSQNGKEPQETGFDTDHLESIARSTVELPDDFNVHPRL